MRRASQRFCGLARWKEETKQDANSGSAVRSIYIYVRMYMQKLEDSDIVPMWIPL